MKVKEARKITDSLTRTSKMPGLSYQPGPVKPARSSGRLRLHLAMAAMH